MTPEGRGTGIAVDLNDVDMISHILTDVDPSSQKNC
jgi:hypothetical protein